MIVEKNATVKLHTLCHKMSGTFVSSLAKMDVALVEVLLGLLKYASLFLRQYAQHPIQSKKALMTLYKSK